MSNPEIIPTLLPCPFCGNTEFDESVQDVNENIGGCYTPLYVVECQGCHASVAGDRDMQTAINTWNLRAAPSAGAGAPTPEIEDSHEREISGLIDERDKAEEAVSQAYYLIIGRSPEWSSAFGFKEALEEIDDAQHLLRESAKVAGAGQTAPATFPDGSYALSLKLRLKAATTEFNHPRMGIVATNKHTMPITTEEAKRLLRLVNEEREDYEQFAVHAGIADPEALSPDAIGFEGRMRSLVSELTRRAQAESELAPMAAFYHCVDAINAQLTVRASAPTTKPVGWGVITNKNELREAGVDGDSLCKDERTANMTAQSLNGELGVDLGASCVDDEERAFHGYGIPADRPYRAAPLFLHPSSPSASPEPTP